MPLLGCQGSRQYGPGQGDPGHRERCDISGGDLASALAQERTRTPLFASLES